MDIRTYLKDCFQDRPILQPEQAEGAPDTAIILHEAFGGEEAEIAKTKVNLVKGALNPTERDTISISSIFPPKVRICKAGQEIPKAYIPVADWDGKNLRMALPENTISLPVRNALFAGLPRLLRLNTDSESGAALLRQKMSLGLTKERGQLLENAEKNRRHVEKEMASLQRFLESAERQERIAAGLEKLEEGQLDEFARSQWEDLSRLVPNVLQDVYVKGDSIEAITNPIVISGVLVGSCKIRVDISSAKVMVFAVERSSIREGHCHPHVQDDGNPCWGNLDRTTADMAAKKDYYGLISAALRLLHQYVHDDAYAKLDRWGNTAMLPDEGLNCRNFGPSHSYSQMRICLECEEKCPVKEKEKIEACKHYHLQEDCKACKVGGKCSYWDDRFTTCYHHYIEAGVAYCMIKCRNDECPYTENARGQCKRENRPEHDECPAKTLCRKPCER